MNLGDSKESTTKEEQIKHLKEIGVDYSMALEQDGKNNDVTLSVQPMPLPEAQREALPGAYAQGGRPRFAPPVRGRPPAPVRSNSDDDTVQTNDTEGLVEARAVDDKDHTTYPIKDLEMAKPVVEPSKEVARKGAKREFIFLLLCFAVLFGGATLLGSLTSTSSSSIQDTAAMGGRASPSDSSLPSQKDHLSSLLPDISLKAIEEDSKSSQSKAFDWLVSDPSFPDYTPERIQQRFALATLFYATGGNGWSNNDHWLSYETHECHWHHTPECFHWCECEDEQAFLPCDETNTTYLEISLVSNELKGTLPPELFLLPSLESVTIKGHNDMLTGTLPTELMNHSQALWNLHLSGNSLTGTVPTEVLQMKNLTHLRLCCNEFEGSVPTELGLFGDQLLELVLDTNKLEGTIPTELALLAQMTDLRLAINDLTGTLPTEFGILGELEWLRMHELPITGSLPTEYGMLSKLEYLRISHLPITGSVPTEYGLMSNLEYFRMENTTVTGSIPTVVGLWEKLTKLYITDSPNLEGSMPSQLGLLTALKLIYLNNNSLTGTIPTEFGGIESLQHAYLHDNEITGTLPTELGRMGMKTLTQLKLFDNELTGSIPSELGLFQVIETFELQGNILSGLIPEDLASLANNATMGTFNISNNNLLVGSIPDQICNVNFTSFDCGVLCGCDCPCSN